jgi:hypothetical protein
MSTPDGCRRCRSRPPATSGGISPWAGTRTRRAAGSVIGCDEIFFLGDGAELPRRLRPCAAAGRLRYRTFEDVERFAGHEKVAHRGSVKPMGGYPEVSAEVAAILRISVGGRRKAAVVGRFDVAIPICRGRGASHTPCRRGRTSVTPAKGGAPEVGAGVQVGNR